MLSILILNQGNISGLGKSHPSWNNKNHNLTPSREWKSSLDDRLFYLSICSSLLPIYILQLIFRSNIICAYFPCRSKFAGTAHSEQNTLLRFQGYSWEVVEMSWAINDPSISQESCIKNLNIWESKEKMLKQDNTGIGYCLHLKLSA